MTELPQHLPAAIDPTPAISPLLAPQTARTVIRLRKQFRFDAEVRTTPLGLLAIGGLVAAILLAVPPIIRASGDARRKGPPGS